MTPFRLRMSRRSQALTQAAVAGRLGGELLPRPSGAGAEGLWAGVIRRLETARWPDLLSAVYRHPAAVVAGTPARQDLLTGRWLGQAVHPMLTVAVRASWSSATTLDLSGGQAARSSARRLVGIGLLLVPATVATGLADWQRTEGADRRVGAVHAGCNTIATALMLDSYVSRHRGRQARAVLTAACGNFAATVSGYLGGHLAARRAGDVQALPPASGSGAITP